MKFNLYSTLGLKPKATQEEIKKAYRKIAMDNHPDKHPNNKTAMKKMLEANEAYETLSNPTKKKDYDDKMLRYLKAEIEREKMNADKRTKRPTAEKVKRNEEKESSSSIGENLKEVGKSVLVKILRTVLRR